MGAAKCDQSTQFKLALPTVSDHGISVHLKLGGGQRGGKGHGTGVNIFFVCKPNVVRSTSVNSGKFHRSLKV